MVKRVITRIVAIVLLIGIVGGLAAWLTVNLYQAHQWTGQQ